VIKLTKDSEHRQRDYLDTSHIHTSSIHQHVKQTNSIIRILIKEIHESEAQKFLESCCMVVAMHIYWVKETKGAGKVVLRLTHS